MSQEDIRPLLNEMVRNGLLDEKDESYNPTKKFKDVFAEQYAVSQNMKQSMISTIVTITENPTTHQIHEYSRVLDIFINREGIK